MKHSMKLVVALLAVVAIAGFGYWQYTILRDNRVIDSMEPAVKNTSLRVTNALALLHSPNATYQESFRQLDADITEIGNRLLDVQTASTSSTALWMRAMGGYLTAGQELLRAQSGLFRRRLQVTTALNSAHDSITRFAAADSDFERNYLNRQSSAEIAEAQRQANLLKAAGHDFVQALDRFATARERLTSFMPHDALTDPTVLSRAKTEAAQAVQ